MFNQLPPTSYGPDKTWVREIQAVEITGMSLAWFRKQRQKGGGIPYTKLGRNVRYELVDIYAYMEKRKVGSTSEHNLLRSSSAN